MRHTPCGCRSADLVEVRSNSRLSPVSTMRRALAMPHSVGSLSPDKRHSRLTIVRRGCNRCRIAGIHAKPCTPHPHCAARAVIQAANCQCRGVEGGSPRPFSWGCKGDILFREREYPLSRVPHTVWGIIECACGRKKRSTFRVLPFYSTVTDFARLRGLSISHPRWSAI